MGRWVPMVSDLMRNEHHLEARNSMLVETEKVKTVGRNDMVATSNFL